MASVDKLGNYIERLDRPNIDLRYGIDDVCGITNTKQLVRGTKANLIGRTFEKFTILAPREFIFNRRTSRNGERISLGYNQTGREWILTEDYCHFRVRKDKEDVLDPDFLYLFFLNPEFDRYVRFNSWGSATEFFNWEEMVDVPIPILPVDEQRKLVRNYNNIERKVKILNKVCSLLEETALLLYKSHVSFNDGNRKLPNKWEMTTIGDVVNVTRGASPRPIQDYVSDSGMPWVKIADASASPTKYLFMTDEHIIDAGVKQSRIVSPGTMIVSNSASPGLPMIMEIEACVHDGWLIINNYNRVSQEYLYYHFINERQSLILSSNGSVFNNLKTDIVKKHPIVVPDEKTMSNLTEKMKGINKRIRINAIELNCLLEMERKMLTVPYYRGF